MSNVAIRVENLGKMYRIGGQQENYSTIRDTISNAVTAPYRKVRDLLRGESASGLKEEIWALKDVSFEVKHGEVVGIIGRNGAGKSTLLKILSRITEPTTGHADIYGRVGALLEVGTGFHPELTGRENIFLNGAILGMSRAEINRKFDEIVDFAGVEKFIDTPVKHYSSGMGLRLGFAVAAYLEPEILIVDEVLAVGDAEFQKKCLGKMSDVASEGRTVLFVSHNMAAVQSLCERAVLLQEGYAINDGAADKIIDVYTWQSRDNKKSLPIHLPKHQLSVVDVKLEPEPIQPFKPLKITVTLLSQEATNQLAINLTFSHRDHPRYVFSTSTRPHNDFQVRLKPGLNHIICELDELTISSGQYTLGIGIAEPMKETLYFDPDVLVFEVIESTIPGSTLPSLPTYGFVYIKHEWSQAYGKK